MDETRDNNLSDEERDALRALASSSLPKMPPGLEEKTVAALRSEGLIKSSRRNLWTQSSRWVAVAASIVVVFVAGLKIGEQSVEQSLSELAPVADRLESSREPVPAIVSSDGKPSPTFKKSTPEENTLESNTPDQPAIAQKKIAADTETTTPAAPKREQEELAKNQPANALEEEFVDNVVDDGLLEDAPAGLERGNASGKGETAIAPAPVPRVTDLDELRAAQKREPTMLESKDDQAELAGRDDGYEDRDEDSVNKTKESSAATLGVSATSPQAGSATPETISESMNEQTTFALLVYREESEAARRERRAADAAPTESEAQMVRAEADWIRELAAAGHRVEIHTLGEPETVGRASTAKTSDEAYNRSTIRTLVRFYIITAASMDEVRRIAERSPYVRAGAEIEIRLFK